MNVLVLVRMPACALRCIAVLSLSLLARSVPGHRAVGEATKCAAGVGQHAGNRRGAFIAARMGRSLPNLLFQSPCRQITTNNPRSAATFQVFYAGSCQSAVKDLRVGMIKYSLNATTGKSSMRLFVTSTSERSLFSRARVRGGAGGGPDDSLFGMGRGGMLWNWGVTDWKLLLLGPLLGVGPF
jgi:hypothetical protein